MGKSIGVPNFLWGVNSTGQTLPRTLKGLLGLKSAGPEERQHTSMGSEREVSEPGSPSEPSSCAERKKI